MRQTLPTPLLLVCQTLFAGACCGQQLAVRSGDGLVLGLSPRGEVTTLAAGDTSIPLHQPGGFFLVDYKNQPEPQNLVPNSGFEEGTQGWSLAATVMTLLNV